MEKNANILLSVLVVISLVLAGALVYVVFYEPEEEDEPEEEPIIIEPDMHLYNVSWEEISVDFTDEEINELLNKARFFFDGNRLNGILDGTTQFYLKFNIPEKFLKEVTITIYWKDRFTGLLGIFGRDELRLSVATPDGQVGYPMRHAPGHIRFLFTRILKLDDPNTYNNTVELNENPPNVEIIANNSEAALNYYWSSYDILDYNKGYDSEWEITGQVYTGEYKPLRRVRNLLRNFILNVLNDPLSIQISYTYYDMKLEDLGAQ